MAKPLLSIGMIFKNEIRCLERCMKSLQPLRDSIPCELVMADTGSDDGSRDIAAHYADILVDFPWVNDFSAARNAVMDRCSGEWYLTIDADEWLDKDFSQLIRFLRTNGKKEYVLGGVIQRNYATENFEDLYSDFMAVRLVKLSTGVRYTGAIHEAWPLPGGKVLGMNRVILHHDGYLGLNTEKGREKRRRNMALLREELEQRPDDLKVMLQCIESSGGDPECEHYIRIAVKGVEKKLENWEKFGPAIFRHAVNWACGRDLPERDEWIERARTWFPHALLTNIDVEYTACVTYSQKGEYAKAISAGEAYIQAIEDYRTAKSNMADMLYSSVGAVNQSTEYSIRLTLANAYFKESRYEVARDMLATLDCVRLVTGGEQNMGNYLGVLFNLHAQSGLDMSQFIVAFWEKLGLSDRKDVEKAKRLYTLASIAMRMFRADYLEEETAQGYRHAYTVFLPLASEFELGKAAQILETVDPEEIEAALHSIEDWDIFPIFALNYALRQGVRFPLAGKPLNIEAMDAFASRLAQEQDSFLSLIDYILQQEMPEDTQQLAWMRGLILLAVQKFEWGREEPEIERGFALLQRFAEIERVFLPQCYAFEVMCEEKLFLLPPMHRFGYYFVQAVDALAAKDFAGYTRLLHTGLNACENANKLTAFLLEHTPELKQTAPSVELLALAEQIRGVLANFAPGDPAVAALKQSEAYQSVAHLIEGAPAVGWGGLAQ